MKFNRNNQAQVNALYGLLVAIGAITFYFIAKNFSGLTKSLQNLMGIISPFIMGFVFAYLLIRPLRRIENALEKYLLQGRLKDKPRRILSILITLLLVGIFIGIVSAFVVPQLIESLSTLTNSLPGYVRSFEKWLDSLMISNNFSGTVYEMMAPYWQNILEYLSKFLSQLAPWLINLSMGLASKVLNMFISLVVAIYFLYNKELFSMQLKKLCYAILPVRTVRGMESVMAIVDDTFGNYINGQLTDAIVVGTLTAFVVAFFKLPYALLIGVIVACTNVIPMVGPFIGAIPSTFIILMAGKPTQALLFVVLIFIIQQIDGNILVPKIVGDSTGLSGFWVLFAIAVSGGLFGLVGIVLCVPTLSVFFKLLKLWVEKTLAKRGLPVNTTDYQKGAEIKPLEPSDE